MGRLRTRRLICQVSFVFIPSLIGSIGFVFASWVYLFEVTSSPNPLLPPRTLSVGYFIALLNLSGSGLYTVASSCYFYPESESEGEDVTATADGKYLSCQIRVNKAV